MVSYTHDIEVDFKDSYAPNRLSKKLFGARSKQGWESFTIRASEAQPGTFPNIAVPIAGIIDHYRRLGCEIDCAWAGEDSYLNHTSVHNPYIAGELANEYRLRKPFDIVWKYSDSTEVKLLIDAVLRELRETKKLEQGLLPGIEWCLNETMDNVLQHSEASFGYFMESITSNRLSMTVYDNGRGIYESLKQSKHHPQSSIDALTLALREGVTRDDQIGQGNGLWGFSEIIQANGGNYTVSSHGAKYVHLGNESSCSETGGFYYGSEGLGTTLIDFQLDLSKGLDIETALHGYSPTQLWLEDLESESGEEFIIRVAERSEGTGTRIAGARIRNLALNTMVEGGNRIILDFEGISVVSSSYADELIGKLVAEVGFSVFNHHVLLKNVSRLNQRVIDRSVQQRMAQQYYNEPPMEDDYPNHVS